MRLAPVLALAAVLAAPAGLTACRRDGAGRPLRVGYFPNVTHAQALVGLADGTFSRALGGRIEARAFNAGPAAMEALLAGDLDVSWVGPGPAVTAYLRSRGEGLRVVAGATSGGAVLVVRGATGPRDLAGKKVASPQLGNTQDVALRTWLRANGLSDRGGPDGVEVVPVSNADILSLFARGQLEGAWVPEPWGARLLAEAKGRILVDERDLWEGGRFPTALVVASARALATRRSEVVALLRAHAELTRRWQRDPEGFARAANGAFARLAGKGLPDVVLQDAFSRLAPTLDPLPRQLAEGARHARALGFTPPGDVSGLVDGAALAEAAGGRPAP
jgi:NitT/TauT family transport system substrate-binding protein